MAKRKKNPSSNAKRAQQQRAAAARRQREAAGEPEMPEDIAEMLADEHLLPEWAAFYRAYPTVTAAVDAAREGEKVELYSFEHAAERRRVLVTDEGAVIEVTFYPPYFLQEAIFTGYLNHPDPRQAADAIRSALPRLIPESARVDGIEYITEPSPGPIPRFAYRYRTPVDDVHTWREYDELTQPQQPLYEAMLWHRDSRAEGPDSIDVLREFGVPATVCTECGHALTNQHPSWPSTWVSLEQESGPVCQGYDDSALDLGELDGISIHGPHQPEHDRSVTG